MKARLLRAAAIPAALVCAAPGFAQVDRTVLPVPTPAFDGTMGETLPESRPGTAQRVRAPQGAPNVLLFMSDDVGFAMASTFGGPVPTPNFDRLAASGQRYNRFHTTGICSPSRAALLTGRNHHNAGVGWLSDIASPYPGYGGRILPETATIAQVLRHNGYSTAMFGKHHNVPGDERSEAGPFDAWPTGIGFDYFVGFPYGDTDQFSPQLYRGVQRVDMDEGAGKGGDKLLDTRLADDLIRWVHNQKAGAPNKPFLAYWAPGSTHAPHQAPPEWIARFKGQFDSGWDRVRAETLSRQIRMGVVPRGTKLSARPDGIPAWESLSPQARAFHARTMEVAAAQLAWQDAQVGRVLDELARMGELDRTLVAVVLGDNGASGEAGPKGTVNELRSMGTHDERPEFLEGQVDRLGGRDTYQNYSVGWAWAMNAPLRWVKQYASMLGGIRNGMILSWPGHVARPGTVCSRFSHLIDIAPTVLEATGLPAPRTVLGAAQKPIDGKSMLASLAACDGAEPRTQYFEIGGKVGLYHDGWFLSGEDGRPSWENLPPAGANPPMQWTLYDLARDWAQATDVSAREPAKLAQMIALFREQARANNVFPLDHRFAAARATLEGRGDPSRKHYDFWGKEVSVPANIQPILMARAFTLEADLLLDRTDASGAVVALGSRFGGWSLYLDRGRPAFTWSRSTDPREIASVRADRALPAGKVTLRMRFETRRPGGPADVVLSAGGSELARMHLPANYLMPAGGGETLDIGRDLGVTVTDYATPRGAIEGDVSHVRVDFD
jgi:arylsulfatase A-like enzyme